MAAEPIVAAGIEALQQGKTKYTSAQGVLPLREKISEYYANQGLDVVVQIQITSGASGGLVLLAGLLLDPGDVMLITDPNTHAGKCLHD